MGRGLGRPLSLAGRWSRHLSGRSALAAMTGCCQPAGGKGHGAGTRPPRALGTRGAVVTPSAVGCGQTGSRRNGAETAVRRLEPRKALGRPGGDRVTNRRHLLLQRCPGPLGEGGSEPWEVPTKLTGQVTERSTRTAFRARARLEAECEREGATAKWRGRHTEEEGRPNGEKNGCAVQPMTVPRTQWGRRK